MFIDSVALEIASGKGGPGAVSYRREKFVPKGGPDGGDGGDGGSVYFLAANNCDTLSHFRGKKKLAAQNGANGEGRNRHGKNGEDLVVTVPVGTQVVDAESKEVLLDLTEDGQKLLFLQGGKGGLGNTHFKNPANQRPSYAQPGLPGESKQVRLELKLIADVGLAGFPNVGKSTLISVLSNAKPEIANYEFTTLTPNLGVVDIDLDASYVIADIPGIIEGASDGKGLGLEFLKHIERTAVILYVIDITNYRDIELQFSKLKAELINYSNELAAKPSAIVLSKCDMFEKTFYEETLDHFAKQFKGLEKITKKNVRYYVRNSDESEVRFILPISSVSNINLDILKSDLYELAKEIKAG